MNLTGNKKLFFASDAHFGFPGFEDSLVREKHFVAWLKSIEDQAAELYLLGDVFDFWFEYKRAVPRGFTRLLGTLAGFSDKGIPVHFFTGNHDIWVFDYLPQETGVIMHREPYRMECNGKKFYLAHGDSLGPDDKVFKRLRRFFNNKTAQYWFEKIHPDIGIGLAHHWSYNSRNSQGNVPEFRGENEWLIIHSREELQKEHFDFMVYGHRHVAIEYMLTDNTKFVILGDWINRFSYGEFDGIDLVLKNWPLAGK
ncbi:MAG: UDP-2,3-diacylglucosamine diphosphatase [Bacteroidia bacterium]|nr:UDP-2,3-diacylglucosamine diphosphatase [Bacteroidia bacterium]